MVSDFLVNGPIYCMPIFVSSPCNGGLFSLDENLFPTSLIQGNIRGLCFFNGKLCYAKGNENCLFCDSIEILKFDGKASLHDVKFFNNHFYVMATEFRSLLKFNTHGEMLKEVKFESNYWPNCCITHAATKKLIVFLSAKRPFSNSKIICYDENWNVLWEFLCFEGDEVHSPFLFGDTLYWCRSNHNAVMCGSMSMQLKDVRKVLVDDSGYTRGLCIVGDNLYLGTSENRHAKTSLCNSLIDSGTIRHYTKEKSRYVLKKTVILPVKEVYDIVYDKDIA